MGAAAQRNLRSRSARQSRAGERGDQSASLCRVGAELDQANYWETPFEFIRKNGQCQDYATTKFLLLRAAGVPNDAMRLVVVHDIERDLDHAVLVVYVE